MSKITIIEGNNNEKNNVRAYMVKGEKGDVGDPTKLSQLENDTGFITKDVENLTNYYDKEEIDETVQTLNNTIDEKADTTEIQTEISNINTTLNQKANTSDVSNTYATKTQLNTTNASITSETVSRTNADANLQSQINSLASGSPKGTYASVSALQSANPATGVYIVTADGHIYSWTKNGSTAIDLGSYQSTGLDLDTTLLDNTKAPNSLIVGNAIRRIETMIANKFQIENFALGDINNQHNFSPNKTYRIATTSLVKFSQEVILKIPTYWKIYLHTYNNSGEYIEGLGWRTGVIKLTKDMNYMFVIARTSEDTTETLNVATVMNQFIIVPANQIELNLNYGGILRITPTAGGIIDIKQQSDNLIVTVPSAIFLWKQYSGGEAFTRIDLSETTFTLANNYILVFNIIQNKLEVKTQLEFNSDKEKYIILLWNHYGNPKGQWDKYYYFNQISTLYDISKEEKTVEFTCRQGQVDNYPENTLIAFKRAKEWGYNHIRTSIVFSSDGIPVCSHSDQVNGSTLRDNNGNVITDTSIYLSNLTYNQIISNFDAGIYKGSKFEGVRVPSFESVLIQAKRLNQKVDIEFKGGYSENNIDNLLIMIYKYGMQDNCLFTSTDLTKLNYVKENEYPIKLGLIIHLAVNTVNAGVSLGVDRIDIFDDDNFNLDAVLLARKNNIKIKMGSAYNMADVINFIDYYDVIECANIKNPTYDLILS